MSYQVYIFKAKLSPHPNADKLQLAHIGGSQVVVGMDMAEDDLIVFFPSDGQLSKEFADAHDLVARKDDQGNKVNNGYFSENRRVRAQAFRGIKSEGFAVPVSYLAFTKYDLSKLKEGDSFDTLGGVPIANKYFTKATLAAIGTKKKIKQYADFPEHTDTTQFRFIQVPEHCVIHITEKEHGTSVRYGNVMVHKPLSKWAKFWRGLLGKKGDYTSERQYVLGTRRAILPKQGELAFGGGYYGNGDPYTLAAQKLHGKLKDDEIVYGELVGYLQTGTPLFTQNTGQLKDIKKLYGEVMNFSYGCVEGTAKFRVYRITQNGRDLTHYEMLGRCEQLGVDTVHVIESIVYDGDRDALNARVASHLEGASLTDPRHIREGVCLRIESPQGTRIVKAKSWTFGILEGYLKDNDSYVDAEEIA